MSKVHEIKPKFDYQRDAIELLESAKTQEFDTVVILGFYAKTGQMSVAYSSVKNMVELLGALRLAENTLIEEIEGDGS